MKNLFAILTLSLALTSNIFAGNDNVPVTNVSVEEIKADIEMPKVLRSGRTTAQGVSNLAIDGFNMNVVANSSFNLNFTAPGKGDMYVRIVDAQGYDVYFETVKGNSTTYNKQIDLSSLQPGTYFFQVTRGKKTFNKKLVFN